ncbi:MAG TPA: hypothetical protein VMY88_06765 [Acidimicrobiales bacterium]|nr:hypothetical protein [Acidimicrobiales bacterium]
MRKSRIVLAAAVLAVMALGSIPGSPASAQVPFKTADFSGYATASAVHVDALQLGQTGPLVANVDEAFSSATVASQGTDGITFGPNAAPGTIVNEVDNVLQPNLANTELDAELKGDRSYGRGSGLEVGLANSLPIEDNTLILNSKVQGSAPPSTQLLQSQVGPVAASPVAYASLLRGESVARWDDNSCILGEDISQGRGYAADAQLVNTGAANEDGTFATPVVAADAPGPERAAASTVSRSRLVPQTGKDNARLGPAFGLMTEARTTIAPVTLFKGTPNEVTIEVLGEWVLKAVATGVGGNAGNWVHYGPLAASPESAVIRVIQGDAITQLTTQDIPLLGETGLVVNVPGVAEIAIGEDPRAIGGDADSAPALAADGTSAAAAVDLVRVTLLEQRDDAGIVTMSAADVRIGHMETRAKVPAGGIECSLPVTKTVDREFVAPGDNFTYTIKVVNPFADCDLTAVLVKDAIEVEKGILYEITSSTPPASSQTATSLTWNDIGPIPAKGSKDLTVGIRILDGSGAGRFTNTATATGVCVQSTARGDAQVNVDVNGRAVVVAPDVAQALAATGMSPIGLAGGALMGLAVLGRRAARRFTRK